MSKHEGNTPELIDVAVVGGGISGVYSAWRLARDVLHPELGERLTVHLFESSGRIGGRLETVALGDSGQRVDVGAMRFFPGQRLVSSLFQALELPTVPFPSEQLRRLYLRGVLLTPAELARYPDRLPYRLVGEERGKSPFVLLQYVIQLILPNAFELSPSQWEEAKKSCTVNGVPLWQLGFWNLLDQMVSGEAYDYLLNTIGIDSLLSNWNAGEALQLLCFVLKQFQEAEAKGTPPTLAPGEGFQSLALTLAERFVSSKKTKLLLRHRLVSVERVRPSREHHGLELRFELRDEADRPIGEKRVHASHVILAMPKRALELVGQKSPELDTPEVRTLLATVKSEPAYKLYMSYGQSWWNTLGFGPGNSVTDVPLRQVFYGMAVGDSNAPVLLASYTDMDGVSFWKGLAPLATNRMQQFLEQQRGMEHETFGSPGLAETLTPLANVVQRHLGEMHGMKYVPPPRGLVYRDWTEEPYGGGWHSWNPYVEVAGVIGRMRRPVPDLNLYVCGEAYSSMQGWVEGALRSAELVLQNGLRLHRPDWLPADVDLGV
ncbi:FAD-dependent oxidoreductase [Archangium violaceum]|uniref:flavin monoamine oxidase family protein n=1 Tax=Archangium violaceum TaxID=83451 RepID=UPI00194DEC30|nr:FAD-dependent oxidoreductase [Archangium violaceum]QRN96531.1 FAD-dependent oxidoreductase [Archangium violaceum]